MNFDSLKEQVTNLSLYDIKAGVRKVQNGKSSKPIVFGEGVGDDGGLTGGLNSGYELYGDGGEG